MEARSHICFQTRHVGMITTCQNDRDRAIMLEENHLAIYARIKLGPHDRFDRRSKIISGSVLSSRRQDGGCGLREESSRSRWTRGIGIKFVSKGSSRIDGRHRIIILLR